MKNTYENVKKMDTCGFCGAEAGQHCKTLTTGRQAENIHASRVETAQPEQMMFDFHATAREEGGFTYATVTEHPGEYDPNELTVKAAKDGGWIVSNRHWGTHHVSSDYQTVTKGGRVVSTEYREHSHAPHAARAGAAAILAQTTAQEQTVNCEECGHDFEEIDMQDGLCIDCQIVEAEEERHEESAVETAAHFAEARPQDVETIVASLANELGTDVDGARKALAEYYQPGSTTGEETTQTTNNPEMKIKTTGINRQTEARWYFPADRRWKVTLESDGSATVIENSSDLYRVIEGRVFNVRSKRDITENWNAEKYIIPLVHYARKAEAQLVAAHA